MRILFVSFIWLATLAHADFYYMSYKYVVEDFQLYNETLLVSRAMQPCSGTIDKSVILQKKGNKPFSYFVQKNKEKIIDFFNRLGFYVKNQDTVNRFYIHSHTAITFFTQCFKVDFNDNFVRISALKQPNE